MELGATYQPADAAELQGRVNAARISGTPVEVRSGGSKRAIGRPDRQAAVLDVSRLSGVIDYEPSELVLTLGPATPLAEVEALLDRNGQMLAFEPWDHGALFGAQERSATIGGVIAAGIAGPRRLTAGGARDHLLGFSAVSGRGEAFKAGGKVVKNVTGYDLSKVIAGSWGQLAVLTELSVKVVPKPKSAATLVVPGLDASTSVGVMAQALGSVAGPVAAAYLPSAGGPPSQTLLRLEGFAPSVNFRAGQLQAILSAPGSDLLDEAASAAAWRDVREVTSLAGAEALWRIQIAPSRAAALVDALADAGADCLMDWGGALIWAGAGCDTDVRSLVQTHHGHAMLIRAPSAMLTSTPIRHPEQPAVAALSERVRRGFDPAGILDPRRFA